MRKYMKDMVDKKLKKSHTPESIVNTRQQQLAKINTFIENNQCSDEQPQISFKKSCKHIDSPTLSRPTSQKPINFDRNLDALPPEINLRKASRYDLNQIQNYNHQNSINASKIRQGYSLIQKDTLKQNQFDIRKSVQPKSQFGTAMFDRYSNISMGESVSLSRVSSQERKDALKNQDHEESLQVKQEDKQKPQSQEADESQNQLDSQIQSSIYSENERPPPPPQPLAFLRWAAQQTGPIGGDLLSDKQDSDDESNKLFEMMSYSKLFKSIEANHPIDQETKQRYKFSERITVKDFESKLTDLCGCMTFKKRINKQFRKIKKYYFPQKGKKKEVPKPPTSFGLQPKEASSTEDSGGGEDKGLTKCSQSLGDGATLYLQMMYTFTIMFFLLTILNIPIYLLYENNTQGNNLSQLDSIFKYFTIGNLGQLTKFCGNSDFEYRYDPSKDVPENLSVDCGDGVIEKMLHFGFMFAYDKEYQGNSSGSEMCRHIEHPMDEYRYVEPELPTCDVDELTPYELEICEIDLLVYQGLLSHEEADFQYCLIDEDGDESKCLPPMLYEDITSKVFQNNFKIAELLEANSSQQDIIDANYVWITNPSCDKLTYYWNEKAGRSLELTAIHNEENISKIEYFQVVAQEMSSFSNNPDVVNITYDESDQTIISLSINVRSEYVFEAQDQFDVQFEYQTDACEQQTLEMNDNDEEEDEDEESVQEIHEEDHDIDTSIWVKSGDVPEEPNTDQYQYYGNIDPLCGYSNTSSDYKRSKFYKLFEDRDSQNMFVNYFEDHCYGQKSCTLDPKEIGYQLGDIVNNKRKTLQQTGLFGLVSDDCKLRMSDEGYGNITSKQYIGIFGCKYDDVQLPFSQNRVHKEVIGVFSVTCDFICILIMIYFFKKLENLNKEWLVSMDNLRVQMKDFGVLIENVVLDKQTYDSRLIKMKIWLHFKELLASKKDKYNDMECIDVCLSIYSQPSIQLVFRMQEIQLVINHIKTKLLMNEYKDNKIADKQEKLKYLIEKRERFERRYSKLVQKVAHDSKTENILNVQRIPKVQRLKQIQYVFVVFKNCETRNIVEKIYEKPSGPVECLNCLLGTFKPSYVQDNKLFGKNIEIRPMIEPDQIIWENLVYTKQEQKARIFATQIFSVFFLLINIIFTIYLQGFQILMDRQIPAPVGCPEVTSTKEDAYLDFLKDFDDNQETKATGLLGCYCKAKTSFWLPWTIIGHNFIEFSDSNDSFNHCAKWHGLQILKSLCLSFVTSSAVVINELVATSFQYSGKFQKKHTKIEEQITVFQLIFTQEYINMAIIVLITGFDQIGIKEYMLGEYAGDNRVYKNFSANWYMDFGNKICIFIFMSAFVINSADIVGYLIKELQRCYDRKGSFNIKLDPDDEDCDLPQTRQRLQSRLEKLYMGKEFQGEKAYSRMMSTLFVILMYCSGMPIVYLNGFIFFFVTYIIKKYLIINFYQKSRTLNRSIPMFSVSYLKYGIALHICIGIFMLTNKEGFETKSVYEGVKPIVDFQARHGEQDEHGQIEESVNGGIVNERLKFFHQQLYVIYIFSLIITILIGKNFYIILSLIIKGIKLTITGCCKAIQKFIQLKMDYVNKKRNKEVKKQNDALQQTLKKQVTMKFEHQTTLKLQKSVLRMNQARLRADEDAMYQQRKADELDQCQNLGSEAIQILLEKHLIEDQQREIKEQQRIEREKKEDAFDTTDVDKVKAEEKEKKRIQEEQEKIAEELRLLEIKEMQIHQLTMRTQRPDYSDNILLEFDTQNLSNFYQRCIRELSDYWEIFQYNDKIEETLLNEQNKSPYKDLFLETCYTYRISTDEAFQYQAFLIQRIKDVEQVIDKYIQLLKLPLKEKMINGFERDRIKRKNENKDGSLKDQLAQTKYEQWFIKYSDELQFDDPKCYPYSKKMKILVHYQDELLQADVNRKDNKLFKPDICRMTGSRTQSYFIFDALQFKVARKIYYGLEKDEHDEQDHEDEGDGDDESSQQDDDFAQKSFYSRKSRAKPSTKSFSKQKYTPSRKSKPEQSEFDKSEYLSRKSLKSSKTRKSMSNKKELEMRRLQTIISNKRSNGGKKGNLNR